jgi:hypothetical protein
VQVVDETTSELETRDHGDRVICHRRKHRHNDTKM